MCGKEKIANGTNKHSNSAGNGTSGTNKRKTKKEKGPLGGDRRPRNNLNLKKTRWGEKKNRDLLSRKKLKNT